MWIDGRSISEKSENSLGDQALLGKKGEGSMGKIVKVILTVAAILVALGLILFVVVMSCYGWDFTKLNMDSYVTNTHTLPGSFHSIAVDTNTADVLFAISDDETCQVVCREQEKLQHAVQIQDGVLKIAVADTRKWYEYIGISWGQSQITVYLPQRDYESVTVQSDTSNVALPRELSFDDMHITVSTGNVSNFASVTEMAEIETSTGKIWVEDISAGSMVLSTDTGHITVSNVTCQQDVSLSVSTGLTRLTNLTCKNLSSTGSTGDLNMTNVVASGDFFLERSTGDITFTKCDAAQIQAQTSTGDVTGTLLSDKVYITETSTGSIDVPKTIHGGKCEISTDTGDIHIQIED